MWFYDVCSGGVEGFLEVKHKQFAVKSREIIYKAFIYKVSLELF